MKNKILVLVIALLISGCFNKKSKDESKYEAFKRKLVNIDTPITFDSDYEKKIQAQDLSEDPFFTEIQNDYPGFTLHGLLFEARNFIAILGSLPTDSGTPIILTFDNSGNKIDSHVIYENAMGDIGIYIKNSSIIFPDRRISFIDSTLTRKLTDDGSDEIPGTDSISVKEKKYYIDDSGRFKMTE